MKKIILTIIIAISTISFTSCESSKPAPRSNYSSYQPRPVVFKPLVTIRNNSSRQVTIGLQGPETRYITIPARSSRSINLYSGSYRYAAAAANTRTISGYKYFGTNRTYTWNFSIN